LLGVGGTAMGIGKQNILNPGGMENRGLITALKIMVTIPSEFKMDLLTFHIILGSSKKMETEWNKRKQRNQEEIKEVL
jgi:hypothetical protein